MMYFQPDAFALRVDILSYPYPYKNPYLATATVAIMKGRDELLSDDAVFRRSLKIKILENRDDLYLLEGMGTLRVRFYQQPRSAPLIFIIPGLGSSAYSGAARYIAELLVDEGFHVLILPSPFNWNFTLAASRSGFPGLIQEDSEDLYSAMQLTLNYIKEHYGAKVGRTGLIGLSNGALYAAYISQIDAEQKNIGIATYLLVNPPVDLLEGIEKIDQMAQLAKKFGTEKTKRIEAYGLGVAAEVLEKEFNDPFSDPEYFANWDKRFHLTDKQIQYLIGRELQSSIGDVIYVLELVHYIGVLRTPISYTNRNDRFNEAHSYSLMDYVKVFLIPRLKQRRGTQPGAGALNVRFSLKEVESTLMTNKNIFVMHNRDDFLVSSADLDYLEGLLGDRAKIYPYGGHMGNLWYSQNRKDIVSIFKPLLKAQ